MSVDFPAPVAPTIPTRSPGFTSNETLRSTYSAASDALSALYANDTSSNTMCPLSLRLLDLWTLGLDFGL